jgi:hypothetical protein
MQRRADGAPFAAMVSRIVLKRPLSGRALK